jgi:glycine/D-amino acid oxidase-like deaminating enzyme
MELDVLIFGGGAAGLWLLDQLSRRGNHVLLLEAGRLGQGQTVASQGIIHGGLKYTLHGALTSAAREIREMPEIWRDCLAGRRTPDLRNTRLRSSVCYLWRSASLRSRLGMLGARLGLHVGPVELAKSERPAVLAGCPGIVARLDEQVIDPASLLADLASQNRERILLIDPTPTTFKLLPAGPVDRVVVARPDTGERIEIQPRQIIFTAGGGNAGLRRRCGLPGALMQRRPLHMVLVRGRLPVLNGHCVDGARTRVTITSDVDLSGNTIWQVGGQIAEEGVAMNSGRLIRRTSDELTAVLPGVDLLDCEWTTYRIDRAEHTMPQNGRPDTASVLAEGNVITAWPTKLALIPQLVRMVEAALQTSSRVRGEAFHPPGLEEWPRPEVAAPPWETATRWERIGPSRARDAA